MNQQALVLHLSRAQARSAQVQRIRAACPWPTQVLEAVDGRALTTPQRQAVLADRPLYEPPYPFAMNPGEVGCFLSHRLAWQTMLIRDIDVALILEDDVELQPEALQRVLPLATQAAGLGVYVQLQVRRPRGPCQQVMTDTQARVLVCRPAMLRTSAQVIARTTAEKLLQQSQRLDRPIDAWLQLTWETGVPVWMVEPSGVRDATPVAGGSTIQASPKPILERLRREFLRWNYRRKLAVLAKRRNLERD